MNYRAAMKSICKRKRVCGINSNMLKIAMGIVSSVICGVFGHLVFFPVIEAWNNQRMRRLARPAIGVVINTVPFLIWIRILCGDHDDDCNNHMMLKAFVAYCISFLWDGAGVVAGYLIDDWRSN